MQGADKAPLLAIRGLRTHFATDDGMVQAVDGVDLTIHRGETDAYPRFLASFANFVA